uniref:sugar phosphate nucleotidyltransferase n=1 Tax=Wolbachia endosymbiont (group A) of Hylaeus communis TaxID=2954018 RepID=UPI00222FB295|nr:sugar phosphate nucleotidyltransferase [Wolbachia endosymbiont (group A) of Hylaeus communis]
MERAIHALQEYKVIFEPVKIGTAAAILIAALLCNENEIMLILPSDHFIGDLNSFYASTQKASKLASETNSIVTFGVKPHGAPRSAWRTVGENPTQTKSSQKFGTDHYVA